MLQVDEEVLIPPFDSHERHSSVFVSTFNLVATIVGGGVLSLPLAFEKCGIVLATLLMMLAAFVTDRSLYLLCLAARYSGVHTFGEVGKAAFGAWMEWAISGLLFVFLLFVLVAYMVLVRDIWTPIVQLWLFPAAQGNLVLLSLLLLMSPFLVQRTLYALRFNCYAGFLSISVLCIALCHHASQRVLSGDDPIMQEIRFGPSSFGDSLFAFPIITLSFLSNFNILPIQSGLIIPSKRRMRSVINSAVLACFGLTYLFGLAGYVFAGANTKGNILLNTDHTKDWLVLLGRIGCGTTILLATAMILLPCRDSILEVIDSTLLKRLASKAIGDEDEETCTDCLTRSSADCSNDLYVANENTRLLSHIEGESPPVDIFTNPWTHYGSTFAILALCYLGAVAASGVAVVWSLCGSTMAFLISFILPAACYIRIQERLPSSPESDAWILFSWSLLVVSVMATVACTIQAIGNLLFG